MHPALTSSCTAMFRQIRICQFVIKRNAVSLKEVGKLEECRQDGKYNSGELFLHKKFDYRGVVLFPWKATVYDGYRKNYRLSSVTCKTYYQTLVDLRDWDYIHLNKVNDDITLFQEAELHNDHKLLKIPGLDYVSHDDIQPYTSKDDVPIFNTLFDEFFTCQVQNNGTVYSLPTNKLDEFQSCGSPWLILSKVYREKTRNVQVTVIPFYLGEKRGNCRQVWERSEGSTSIFNTSSSNWWWRYCVRVENCGEKAITLRGSHWKIYCEQATPALENYSKMKVVGREPVLCPGRRTFQFSSHIALETPSGTMWGSFQVEKEDGEKFDCKIPVFNLEVLPSVGEDQRTL